MVSKEDKIVITGASGFIGSCLVQYLNEMGYDNLILVDEFRLSEKQMNLIGKKYSQVVSRDKFFMWLQNSRPPDFIFHLGARTDTTEFDWNILRSLNLDYSKRVWEYCTNYRIPMVYASSAATYGDGSNSYSDNPEITKKLHPLNPYGVSKNEFDKWVISQLTCPPFWAGLKFFNVYGANEYHKGRMASVIFHAFNQIQSTGTVKLFKSYKKGCKDGDQLRDFIYVKDIVKVCHWMLMEHEFTPSAIYNLGTGVARTFNDLVRATFSAVDSPAKIEYVPMPEDIRDKYQYFTEADMRRLKKAGYKEDFYSLEDGVKDYVRNYLIPNKLW